MYAAGKIPGSFFKREGRAGEKATLTARMIDRPLRPLFPKGWRYETQLVSIPLSIDHDQPVRHPRHERRVGGADGLQHPVPDARRRGAHRQGRRQLRRQPDRGGAAHGRPRPDRRRHRRGDPDGRGRAPTRSPRPRCSTRSTSPTARSRSCARAQRELAEKVGKAKLEITAPAVDEGLYSEIQESHGARARRGDARRGQARAPGRHEGRRGGGAREVLGRPGGRHLRRVPRSRAQLAFDKLEKTIIRQRIAVHKTRPDGRAAERDPRRSRSRSACCRARTAPRCSRAARRRRCRSSRSARRARRCAWTTSGSRRPSATSTTTTSRRSRSGRRASCAARSGATSATARSPSGRSSR